MIYEFFLIGVVIHLVAKYRDSFTDRKSFDWKRHSILSLLGIPIGLLLVFAFSDQMDDPHAALMGYTLDSFIKNFESYKWKKIGNK